MHISTQFTQGHTLENSSATQALNNLTVKGSRLRASSKKVNFALIGSHVGILLVIVGILLTGYRAPVEATGSSTQVRSILEQANTSVDQIAAANVASAVAANVDLAVERNVQNLAVTLNAKTELAQTDTTYLTKPQIVQQTSSRKGITGYTAKEGDTVQSVAAAMSVSEDSIRWANKLTSDALKAGSQLQIPGTTGVIYTVKAGDDVAQLADKYKADKDRILLYNDLDGIVAGQQIIIPDGILPEAERPGYRAPAARSLAVSGAVSIIGRGTLGANPYAKGYCTAYAYSRRAELGRPIGGNWGNAATWAGYARAAGFRVDHTPAPGAVMQNAGGWGGMGHVAVVETVNADGSFTVSEMNYRGWNVISTRVVPAGQAGSYNFIH